jgi:hypothetical protein
MAHCHLGLGRLYRRTGDGTKGDELLATAIRMYREMEMGFWLEQADAAPRREANSPGRPPGGARETASAYSVR